MKYEGNEIVEMIIRVKFSGPHGPIEKEAKFPMRYTDYIETIKEQNSRYEIAVQALMGAVMQDARAQVGE